MTKSID